MIVERQIFNAMLATMDYGGIVLELHRLALPDWDKVVSFTGQVTVGAELGRVVLQAFPSYQDNFLDMFEIDPEVEPWELSAKKIKIQLGCAGRP